MKHLELHIIQSVPVSCLNRDDLNSPKTAIFGGVQRARVSSQSWKRAIRELAKEIAPDSFKGERTRLFYEPLLLEMKNAGVSDPEEAAKSIVDALVKLDAKSQDKVKSKTMYFMSPLELKTIAQEYKETSDVKKAIKKKSLKDAADIALFGRMVASDHSLAVEAAAMFSHVISTHKVDNEIDFFTAVDDLQQLDEEAEDDSGAGMMGTLEFNSATYYRFAALNLNMLADENHLAVMSKEERKAVVKTFIEATIKAVPTARKNTMNGNTFPNYVLGVVRETGHPIQLINAFEKPVHSNSGYVAESIQLLEKEYINLSTTWGLSSSFEGKIPETNLTNFLNGMVGHVI